MKIKGPGFDGCGGTRGRTLFSYAVRRLIGIQYERPMGP